MRLFDRNRSGEVRCAGFRRRVLGVAEGRHARAGGRAGGDERAAVVHEAQAVLEAEVDAHQVDVDDLLTLAFEQGADLVLEDLGPDR